MQITTDMNQQILPQVQNIFAIDINNLASIAPRIFNLFLVIGLIGLYWLAFNWLVRWLYKKAKNYKLFSIQRLILTTITIILTILTLIIAFIDNLTVFFGSISLLSAALVFALQDLVSCFFAWIYIETSGQYEVNDSILFTSDTRINYGSVMEIGLFRTKINERLGGETLDREMNTGRILTIPNNYIFKHSLTNLTKNHLLLYHKFKVIVTYESDYKTANKVLEKVLHEEFDHLMLKPDKFFDISVKDLEACRPKVYHNIDSSGVCFTIWFGCKTGKLRPVIEAYSSAILDTFKKNNIDLAYDTLRILRD
jgi:small-conductance mechanosensitive channel